MKKLIILIIVLALIIGGGYYAYNKGYVNKWFPWLPQAEKKDKDGNRIFSDAEIKQYNQYMQEAHDFMTKGDAGQPDFYKQAVSDYQKASAIGNDKFWNPLLGLAEAYRKLHDFNNADLAFNKALQAANFGEGQIYQEKIDMYRNDMKKSSDEIKAVYNEAIQKVMDNANLVLAYATYLRDIGDYKDALTYYEAILKKFPTNQLYIKEIANLKAKIGK